jgi:allantoin racemase
MRLWYQSLAREAQGIAYGADLRKIIDAVVEPGTTVHLQGLSEAAGIGAHYRFLEYHDTKEVLYNAILAEKEGFDAFLIGNITDAGLATARELVNIPVLGLSETSLLVASIMAPTFGLVAIAERWKVKLRQNVEQYGMSGRLAGIEVMETSPLELRAAFRDDARRKDVVARFTAAAEKLLAQGAEAIIPAGGEVSVFVIEAGLHEIGRAPVVTGIYELLKMAEMAVKLRALTGRFTSKRFSYAPPAGDFLQRIREAYGPDVYPDSAAPKPEG